MLGKLNSLFGWGDDDEEKKRKELEGQIPAPVETIHPTQMNPERVGGPAPVETITPTIMTPPVASEEKSDTNSVWDTLTEMGGNVMEAGRGALDYMTESPEDFKARWISEQTENIHPSQRGDMDHDALAKQAEEEWKQRRLNRMLIGGALGGVTGALAHNKGSSIASVSGPKSYAADGSIGKLGTGYKSKKQRSKGAK